MKTIILVSSIFYLLGLKISNQVDLVKKATVTPVVTNKLDYPEKPGVDARFHDEIKSNENKTGSDSLNVTRTSKITAPENKKKI
jgi:hypothetical protein